VRSTGFHLTKEKKEIMIPVRRNEALKVVGAGKKAKVSPQGSKRGPRGPNASGANYRGTKTGKYEKTSGGQTKLSGINDI